MALTEKALGAEIPAAGGGTTYPASTVGTWVILHENLSSTAESATELLRPTVTTLNAGVRLLRVSGACKGIMLRARYDPTITTVTTAPIVRIYGITGDELATAGVLSDTGANPPERIDALTAAAAGLTFTPVALGAGNLRDGTYAYTDVATVSGSPFFDCRGAKWILALTETAANVSGGTFTTVELMVKALNA